MEKQPPALGTINGRVKSVFLLGRKRLVFDGTTKNLVAVAIANGAKAGTKLLCNFGGTSYNPAHLSEMRITEDSPGNFWADQVWEPTPEVTEQDKAEWRNFLDFLNSGQMGLARSAARIMRGKGRRERAIAYLNQLAKEQ